MAMRGLLPILMAVVTAMAFGLSGMTLVSEAAPKAHHSKAAKKPKAKK